MSKDLKDGVVVTFDAGQRIDSAYEQVISAAKRYEDFGNPTLVYGKFNDKIIRSDMTLDECYLAITGKTKAEFDAALKADVDKYEKDEKEWKDKLPDTIARYTEMAKKYISPDSMNCFLDVLPIRLGDIYHGMEIDCLFKIIDIAKKHSDEAVMLDECKKEFDEQGHSGWSAGLTASLIKRFCPDGEKIAHYVYGYVFDKYIENDIR